MPVYPRKELTPQDVELLQKVADGDHLIDAGKSLGLTKREMEYRIQAIRKGAIPSKTVYNLIAEAVRKGIID